MNSNSFKLPEKSNTGQLYNSIPGHTFKSRDFVLISFCTFLSHKVHSIPKSICYCVTRSFTKMN